MLTEDAKSIVASNLTIAVQAVKEARKIKDSDTGEIDDIIDMTKRIYEIIRRDLFPQ